MQLEEGGRGEGQKVQLEEGGRRGNRKEVRIPSKGCSSFVVAVTSSRRKFLGQLKGKNQHEFFRQFDFHVIFNS